MNLTEEQRSAIVEDVMANLEALVSDALARDDKGLWRKLSRVVDDFAEAYPDAFEEGEEGRAEHPADTCGPCRSRRHDRCYAPCLCADRDHAPVV